MSAEGITVDDSMWPLVIVTFRSSATDADWRAMFSRYHAFYARREPFHIVNDGMSFRSGPSASQRKLIADEARAHERESRLWVLGGATVVANAVMRGIVTAITWVAPPAYKLTLHATLADAVDEAFATLSAKRIDIPASARRFRASLGGSKNAAAPFDGRS